MNEQLDTQTQRGIIYILATPTTRFKLMTLLFEIRCDVGEPPGRLDVYWKRWSHVVSIDQIDAWTHHYVEHWVETAEYYNDEGHKN